MLEYKPSERYTVDEALKHPWITGNDFDKINFTGFEMMMIYTTEIELKQVFKIVKFLSYVKMFNTKKNAIIPYKKTGNFGNALLGYIKKTKCNESVTNKFVHNKTEANNEKFKHDSTPINTILNPQYSEINKNLNNIRLIMQLPKLNFCDDDCSLKTIQQPVLEYSGGEPLPKKNKFIVSSPRSLNYYRGQSINKSTKHNNPPEGNTSPLINLVNSTKIKECVSIAEKILKEPTISKNELKIKSDFSNTSTYNKNIEEDKNNVLNESKAQNESIISEQKTKKEFTFNLNMVKNLKMENKGFFISKSTKRSKLCEKLKDNELSGSFTYETGSKSQNKIFSTKTRFMTYNSTETPERNNKKKIKSGFNHENSRNLKIKPKISNLIQNNEVINNQKIYSKTKNSTPESHNFSVASRYRNSSSKNNKECEDNQEDTKVNKSKVKKNLPQESLKFTYKRSET